jgi:dTDP-4-amino-4,6-dideoxygalactose transaminase
MKIPFLDLTRLHATIKDELDAALLDVTRSSAFVGGAAVSDFEQRFAAAHGRRGAAGCGSGTDALVLAMAALGIGPGDEVIVPGMTFVATAEAVVHVGATPVLADVDPSSGLLSVEGVDRVRSEATRAVIPVHLYGHVVPFDRLEQWRADGLTVIEDAAQAHLATWDSRPVGSVGHISCFSFYPGKNLGALGDGGAVVSDDEDVLSRVRSLRDHGSSGRYRHDSIGWCSRLDGVQAAWLRVKLDHLPTWTESRRRVAARYREQLPATLPVPWEEGAVHHLLPVRVPRARRDDVMAALASQGIGTGIHYPLALSEQPALKPWATPCANAEALAAEELSLPMDPLMDDTDVDTVCRALLAALAV